GPQRSDFLDFDRRQWRGTALDEELLAQGSVDLVRDRRVFLEIQAHIVLALADAVALVAVPGARLFDEVVQPAEFDQFALARRALAVQDFELGLAERRRDLVLDDLDARFRADHLVAALDRADAADV